MPPQAVLEFQEVIGEFATRAGDGAGRLMDRISVLSPADARRVITDAYPALIDPFLKAAGELTTQWYAEQPTVPVAPGQSVFAPEPAPLASAEQLAVSGRWALTRTDPAAAIRGATIRHTMNASRDAVIYNAMREGVRWIRQAKPDACGFCKMLATRAAKEFAQYSYTSEGVARKRDKQGNLTDEYTLVVFNKRRKDGRALGQEYHDHCRCTAVPVRDGIFNPPEYVHRWTEQYDAIVAQHGTSDPYKISALMDSRPRRTAPPVPDPEQVPIDQFIDLDQAEATPNTARERGRGERGEAGRQSIEHVEATTPDTAPGNSGTVPPVKPPELPIPGADGGEPEGWSGHVKGYAHPHRAAVWSEAERVRRQAALGIVPAGEELYQHEIESVERLQRLGNTIEWLKLAARDGNRGRPPSHDFRWINLGGIFVELKSRKPKKTAITGAVRASVKSALSNASPTAKENFVIDIGPAVLSEMLRGQLRRYNLEQATSPENRITRLWILSASGAELTEIDLY